MPINERLVGALIFIAVGLLSFVDVVRDLQTGASSFHLIMELCIVLFAGISAFWLLSSTLKLKRSLDSERNLSKALSLEAEKWQGQARKLMAGLSQAIETQLSSWRLSASEKEVAFLLLKVFSLKEIANLRKTSEKTARAQSYAIYEKSGLTGRAQLSAFFLEDLLSPSADQLNT